MGPARHFEFETPDLDWWLDIIVMFFESILTTYESPGIKSADAHDSSLFSFPKKIESTSSDEKKVKNN